MIDEFDRDQDGEISAEEFMYIMKQSTMYWEFDCIRVDDDIYLDRLQDVDRHDRFEHRYLNKKFPKKLNCKAFKVEILKVLLAVVSLYWTEFSLYMKLCKKICLIGSAFPWLHLLHTIISLKGRSAYVFCIYEIALLREKRSTL
jgi:hypothetical protein